MVVTLEDVDDTDNVGEAVGPVVDDDGGWSAGADSVVV